MTSSFSPVKSIRCHKKRGETLPPEKHQWLKVTMTEEDPVAAAAEIKRSQSSLELLSNTAAWKNVVEQQQRSLSPQESSARVSPSDQSVMNSFASSGDFRKEIGLSFDDASSLVRSPTGPASSSAPMDPTLPLLTESSHPTIVSSTTTLASSRTGSASTLTSSVSTSAWRQHLNPSIHRAFTPPLSNSRSTLLARQDTEEDSLVGTRSLHGFHHHTHHPSNNSMLPTSRQGSGDDEGEWSVGVSLESSASAQALQASPAGPADSTRHTAPDYEALQAENRELRALVLQQQSTIKDLTLEREDLLARVRELQQYPNSGKISQIPVA